MSFKAPGYAADAFIDRGTGAYDLTVSKMGFAAVVNDLHKGRDSGPVWKAMIDLSAALLTFVLFGLTGLILIYFIHKHRFSGLLALAGGAAIAGSSTRSSSLDRAFPACRPRLQDSQDTSSAADYSRPRDVPPSVVAIGVHPRLN